jgi:hypothetical protein
MKHPILRAAWINGVATLTLLSTAALSLAQNLDQPDPLALPEGIEPAPVELNESNFQTWRDHILPDERDLAYEQIPWLTTFKDGILAADAGQKPLLLWTMNGHPLGCT